MKKLGIFLVISVIVVGTALYLMLQPEKQVMSTSQKEQALSKLLGRKVDLSDKKKPEKSDYKDSYVEFSYPGDAVIYNYRDPDFASESGLLSSFSYDIKDPKVVFNYAAVEKSNVKSLSDDPSFRLREMPAGGYKKSTIKIDDTQAVLFEKNNPQAFEKSIFIFRGKTLYSFVLTGADSSSLSRVVSLLSHSLKFL